MTQPHGIAACGADRGSPLSAEDAGLILKPEVARRQLDAEMPEPGTTQTEGATPRASPTGSTTGAGPEAAVPRLAQRFYGTVSLHPARVERDAGRIADEVIFHLTALVGSEVKVALEIEAQVPNGIPENTVRTVTENSRTLKFDTRGFERE